MQQHKWLAIIMLLMGMMLSGIQAAHKETDIRFTSLETKVMSIEKTLTKLVMVLSRLSSPVEEKDYHYVLKRQAIEESTDADIDSVLSGISVNGIVTLLHGRDGRDGTDGRDGVDGRDGCDGSPGAPGEDGPPGSNGERGLPGVKGDMGPASNSTQGTPGVPGEVGPPGSDGERGRPGVKGDLGPAGEPGAMGSSGLHGRDGQPGSVGERGPPGMKGVAGAAGNSTQGSAIFTRWGRRSCPENSSIIYPGQMTGPDLRSSGGGSNYQCLPDVPEYGTRVTATQSSLRLMQYADNPNANGRSLDRHRVPCSVCETHKRVTMFMFPAKTSCPSNDWVLEYRGYIMADLEHSGGNENFGHSQYRSAGMYVCVDDDAESLSYTNSHSRAGGVLHTVRAGCTGQGAILHCPPYKSDNSALSCVVCTK